MLQSMTGYGQVAVEAKSKRINIEMRALNGKQLDIGLRLPQLYKEKELIIRSLLKKNLLRGKIDFSLKLEVDNLEQSFAINKKLAKNYHQKIKELSDELKLEIEPDTFLQNILKMPDILSKDETEFDENEWKTVEQGILKAIKELVNFRKQEGRALEKDIVNRVNQIEELLSEIGPYEKNRLEIIKKRLNEQFAKSKFEIDKNRFEQELIFYLEKLDITEEKIRLKNHCQYFTNICIKSDKIEKGKKLSFIGQEIGREINTIGSKAQHVEIQKKVVQMKDELEKIKEQLLNIL